MKKGMSPLQVIVSAIILLAVAVILIYAFKNIFGTQVEETNKLLDTGDEDSDLVPNKLDKCPKIAGDITNAGCPEGQEPTKEAKS